ncbi:MAG: hypothetical protein NC338_01015 [Firmicutes bacterium]|nr:hypothetical protein [Bacillota bacterium]MCM1400392.1 hypothetical protein [Bacteroides sp.]MCM1477149.1 hypothetical protein [Bacteroides sp.]
MKKIFATLLAIFIMAIGTPISAGAQNLTRQQMRQMINTTKRQLPMKVSQTMSWTRIDLESNNTVVHLTFEIVDKTTPSVQEDLKNQLTKMSQADLSKFLGYEFIDMFRTFDCTGLVTFIFPDGTKINREIK